MIIYIMVYAFMTLGAFFIVASLERKREVAVTMVSAVSAPVLAFATPGGTEVIEETAAVSHTETRVEYVPAEDVEDFNGLFHTRPGYALAMLLFLLSLAGIPPTSGFIGKYYIFLSLIETQHYVLAVIGVVFAAVSLYYYFRLVKAMFMSAPSESEPVSASQSLGFRAAILVTGLLTIGIGLYPEPFLRWTQVFGK